MWWNSSTLLEMFPTITNPLHASSTTWIFGFRALEDFVSPESIDKASQSPSRLSSVLTCRSQAKVLYARVALGPDCSIRWRVWSYCSGSVDLRSRNAATASALVVSSHMRRMYMTARANDANLSYISLGCYECAMTYWSRVRFTIRATIRPCHDKSPSTTA